MGSVFNSVKFIKSRQSFHRRKARNTAKINPAVAAKHEETVASYDKVLLELESAVSPTPPEPSVEDLFSLNPLDLDGIPEDLEEELSLSQSDKEDAQIIELLRIAGRPLELNELLIACYRKYEIKHKRNLLTARIYRLIKKKLVHTVGKGKYTHGPEPISEESLQVELNEAEFS